MKDDLSCYDCDNCILSGWWDGSATCGLNNRKIEHPTPPEDIKIGPPVTGDPARTD